MRITDVTAFPLSFPIPEDRQVTLGIGRAVKRDAVLIKVTTDEGLTGWGEAHAGRAPGAIAQLVNTSIRQLVVGRQATDTSGVWDVVYKRLFASHGMGAATSIALSGLDQALWDIRGKAVGWPLYKLLGGALKPIKAYAGGVSLGFQEPAKLVEEAKSVLAAGYPALKLRVGDTPANDIARVESVREAIGDDIDILVDGNANCSLAHVRRIMPALDDCAVGWLEEPFAPTDYRLYHEAAMIGDTPLAAGENHYTRFEFHRLVEDGDITILQPDLSKSGGVTECWRIAALASAWKLEVNPHTSLTALNVAATLHLMCAIDNAGYFEAELSRHNPFRDEMIDWQPKVAPDGTVTPPDAPGLGVEVDEARLARFPVIDGPGYV